MEPVSATLLLAVINTDLAVALIAALLSGGGIGAIAVWRKAGAEQENLSVSTLQIVIGELRLELRRLHDELRNRDEELARLRERVAILEDHNGNSTHRT